jgi:hypothetical protein
MRRTEWIWQDKKSNSINATGDAYENENEEYLRSINEDEDRRDFVTSIKL